MSGERLPTGCAVTTYEPPVPVRSDAVKPGVQDVGAAAGGAQARLGQVPPQAFFGVSAVFHYLGPSLAVLLFTRLDVVGGAWLRGANAAAGGGGAGGPGGRGVRALAAAVAARPAAGPGQPPHPASTGRGAGRDEH